MSILIIGTGFAGIGMAIRLKRAGITDFTLLERAGEIGGTWRDNSYPGCTCDVQSHLYSFSFEPNPGWSMQYAGYAEIEAYLKRCVARNGLEPYIRFGENVERATFDEASAQWEVWTTAGRSYRAAVLVSAVGGLSKPALPDLPGLESFSGQSFHSARWDHGFELAGKRIAVVGTGASAIQFVPEIAKRAAQVDVYQRTPPWVLPKPNRRFRAAERALLRFVPGVRVCLRSALYLRGEARAFAMIKKPALIKAAQRDAAAYLRAQIADPELRRKLTPNYIIGCKRILLSDDWYPALRRPNVEVITDAIERVTQRGVQVRGGVERPADLLIFGTGFEAQNPLPRGAFFGRGGCELWEVWQGTPQAYKGTTVAGFPNLFMLGGPNTGIGHTSLVFMLESQIAYVLDAVRRMRREGWATLEVRRDAQDAYNAVLEQKSRTTVWQSGGCRSWYLNAEGKNTTLWPDFTFVFRYKTRRFDAEAYAIESWSERSGAREPRTLGRRGGEGRRRLDLAG